jgi:hypothetical protein
VPLFLCDRHAPRIGRHERLDSPLIGCDELAEPGDLVAPFC